MTSGTRRAQPQCLQCTQRVPSAASLVSILTGAIAVNAPKTLLL